MTVKVSIIRHPCGIPLTLVPSALGQPPVGNIGDPAPREGQGRGAILPLYSLNSASLNVPVAGYISDATNASFWNVDYYQHHFDVETKTVGFLSQFPCYSRVLKLLHYPRSSSAVSTRSIPSRLPTLPPTSRPRPTSTDHSGRLPLSSSPSSFHPLSPTPSSHTYPRIHSSMTLRC